MQKVLCIENKKSNIIKKIFKKTELLQNTIIINQDIEKIKLRKKIKIIKKINRILEMNKCKTVLLSKDIKKDEELVNLLYSNNINIIDGKTIFKMKMIEVLEYILKRKNISCNDAKLAIISNTVNSFLKNNTMILAKKVKELTIATNKRKEFKKIDEVLCDEGIIITITNNRKKGIIRSDIILNIDIPKEIINLYNIKDDAIIVNFEENVKIRKKRFAGVIIDGYKSRLDVKDGVKNEEIMRYSLLKSENEEKYDFNEILEYYYFLGKIDTEDIRICKLITSKKNEF